MTNLTQQQIDALIQFIDAAEDPATVTNTIVAAILNYLSDKTKEMATIGALEEEATARQNADLTLAAGILELNQLFQKIGAVTYLDSMGLELDGGNAVIADTGLMVYDPENKVIKKYITHTQYELIACNDKTLYSNKVTGYFYRFSPQSGMIQIGGGGSGVTSNLINQIISNIDVVNGRINALIDDLANLAFNGNKTAKIDLDWEGTKVTVSLDTSGLSGCQVNETYPKQVLEGGSTIITIVPTNNAHLLRSASYKVGVNGTVKTVTVTNNQAVITVSNLTEDTTIYLTAVATAKGSFTASISDSRVSGTGASSGIIEGSSWSSELSLNNTAEDGANITLITANMAGGGTISVNGHTVSTNYVTGNITITVSVAVVGRKTITFPALSSGVKITDNSNNNSVVNDGVTSLSVIDNISINWKISPINGYRLNGVPSIQMSSAQAGQSIVPTNNNDGTYSFAIARVTGDVVITSSAREVVNHTITKKLLNYTASDDGTSTTDADFGYKKKSVEDGDDYSVTLSLANSATSNNDLLVKMGGVALDTDNTKTSYYTFDSSNGALVVKNVTADVTIIATAATGAVKVTSTAAVTNGLTISGTTISGTTITNKNYDLGNGETTLEDAFATITKLVFSSDAKAAISAIDFGGAKITILSNVFSQPGVSDPFPQLESVKGLVVNQLAANGSDRKMEYAFANCSLLSELETIGWVSTVTHIAFAFKSTKLQVLDIEDLNCTATSINSVLLQCSDLSVVKLPAFPNVTNMMSAFSTSGLQRISISAGSGITTMNNTFYSCANLEFIDLSGINITSALTDISFVLNGAKANSTLKIGTFDLSNVSVSTVNKMDRVSTLICTSHDPEDADDAMFTYLTALTAIYVPDDAVDTYKTAWSSKASIIHSINDYTE